MFIFSLNLTARKGCVDNIGHFSIFHPEFSPQNFRWRLTQCMRSCHSASTLSVSTWSRSSYGSVTVVVTGFFTSLRNFLRSNTDLNFRIVSTALAHSLYSIAFGSFVTRRVCLADESRHFLFRSRKICHLVSLPLRQLFYTLCAIRIFAVSGELYLPERHCLPLFDL